MATVPSDLVQHRRDVLATTGLSGNAVGIAPDLSHLDTGGYHCGRRDCAAIGRFTPPATAHVGSRTQDYSLRLLRDRTVDSNDASAMDIGSDWPRGGRAAWLRFNRLIVADLRAGNPALAAVRAVNVTLDGTTRLRFDREHGWVQETSKDTVRTHTHVEYYRDTVGRRQIAFDRITQLMRAAIGGAQPAPTPAPAPEDDDMTGWNTPLGQGPNHDYADQYPATAIGWTWAGVDAANAKLAVVTQQLTDLTAAFQALAVGDSSIDTAAVIAHIDERSAAVDEALAEHDRRVEQMQQQLGRVLEFARANLSPAELEQLEALAHPAAA